MNPKAFEAIFRSRFKPLVGYALRFVRDLETARGIVQDVFITLWEKRHEIDSGREVEAYLTTSVRNRCLNYLRDQKKFNRELLDFEGLMGDDCQPVDHLEVAQLDAQIRQAVGELPEKCKEIFLLSRFENLKYQQIADKLDLSVKTVETQMSRALSHLRMRLAAYLSLAGMIFGLMKIFQRLL